MSESVYLPDMAESSPRLRARNVAPLVVLYDVDCPIERQEENCIVLPQMASTAFGDGTHPTTRLCAGAVDLLCRQHPGLSFLDVGTGTGVLARIARARQAMHVIGTDIDSLALEAARRNAALDEHATEIAFTDLSPDYWGPHFDLIAANILEGPLRKLGLALAAGLKPGGRLLLSGFTPLQTVSLRPFFSSLGLTYLSESHLEGWALLLFQKRGK